MNFLKTILSVIFVSLALALAGCSDIASFYSSASIFPTQTTLSDDCATAAAETPPVHASACDLEQGLVSFCEMQGILPINLSEACALSGYATSPVAPVGLMDASPLKK